MTLLHIEHDRKGKFYSPIVYSKVLKRNIKFAIMETITDKLKLMRKLCFVTELIMQGMDFYNISQNRFLMEFLYRDGKQYTGLPDCRARDTRKLHFHFNYSFLEIKLPMLHTL